MNEINTESQSDGLTEEVLAGQKSLLVMKDGEEPPDMLLALLNNALASLVDSQQAKILGKAIFKGGRVGTIVVFYEAEPATANSLKSVGKV